MSFSKKSLLTHLNTWNESLKSIKSSLWPSLCKHTWKNGLQGALPGVTVESRFEGSKEKVKVGIKKNLNITFTPGVINCEQLKSVGKNGFLCCVSNYILIFNIQFDTQHLSHFQMNRAEGPYKSLEKITHHNMKIHSI